MLSASENPNKAQAVGYISEVSLSLSLTYCFVHQMSYTDTIHETSIELINNGNHDLKQVTTSCETVCDYKMYCREICVNIIIDESDDQIGGIGFTVEIDQSKFGKWKYNRSRVIEGQWVLGGICRETKQVFMTTVPSRDKKKTLIPILKKKIKPGTTIISDCWKSYDCLSEEDVEHLTVNHSVNFVDPQTGCHTQNIENLWWQVKRQLPDTYTRHNQLYLHLAEYLWRNMKRKEKDIFKEFLKDASKYYSGPKCNSFYIYIYVFNIKNRHFNSKYFLCFIFVEILKWQLDEYFVQWVWNVLYLDWLLITKDGWHHRQWHFCCSVTKNLLVVMCYN